MKKILLICTQSNQICGFRKELIKKMQTYGLKVCAVAFDDKEKETIAKMGVEFYCIDNANRNLNPFKLFALKKQYVELIKNLKPDIVFTFMLKPNIYGVKAAKKVKVKKIVSMVEGLGDVFINNSLKWKCIRWYVCRMYRSAFKSSEKIFFLNKEDKQEFLNRSLVKEQQCELVNGIGVDLEKFEYSPIKKPRSFLMIARMLRTKGIFEYCQAARLVKQKYPEVEFNYVGGEGSVQVCHIQEYIDDRSIRYFGEVKDVRPYLRDCGVYVLPSYREGMPVSVMEASATGRVLIVSDCPGCNATVQESYNGVLVGVGDVDALAQKMIYFIENPELVLDMGRNSRQYAELNFDQRKINEHICKVIGLN